MIRKCEPDITVIELSGRITIGRESSQIETNVVKVLHDGGRKIVIDLSRIEYIDSTGIGIIAYCFGKITQAGAQCRVSGAKGLVMDLFRITRLENVIRFFPDVDSACESLKAVPGTQPA